MHAQARHFNFYFSLLCISAVMALAVDGCGTSLPVTTGNQPPFQMYETHDTRHPPVESCLDDNPNPPLSCL